ncbi:biotin/lipoyl-binding protein [Rubrobacter tropicus]|uniref:Biotin-dependent 3-methylcrotonyl-coenzyme A carboxylase alpha1 subunit n=1 Tax=Rubrobacter tropicus TaxID=2653851 RepID=A0A6G8QA02_9ACTN|nr:biotin carboxylase N-terminal domain-containing protein [Rubrobacter tropicus]QIN83252.1 biotin/lipoyl-binding protein [Rubrobacter tropicus]
MSFGKLLIANRGEIAVRIIRACRELGVRSVAVYSTADAEALHRRLADEAHHVGPAPAAESYLNVDSMVSVIRECGAEAVHPGYGFLAESAAFARAAEGAGAVWVGPSPEAMDLVGDKVRAKELARRADVPTVPGFDGEGADEQRLAEEAENIGYPVLVKASAGGGGRGMRAVSRPEDFAEAVRGASREAEAAFGDGSVFLEKLIQDPRHVEVQVVGDGYGNVLHLGERECSIQRRHQKVVEEAPSPALDPELRAEICAAAVRLAREAGYRNAGTVEFLLQRGEAGDDFYFLEMNARLQVEHPVTELVTGLDLVHLQLAVAAGEKLPIPQAEISPRGSAIEVRLYAEDENGLPSGGRLLDFNPPQGPGVRNDAGVAPGDEVPLDYDPMLAKLIVWAPDRPTAVRRLRSSLADYEVSGPTTNLPLLRRIAAHPAFAAGETTTGFLERHRLSEPPANKPIPREALLLAAAAELSRPPTSTDPFSAGPWRLLGATRLRYAAGPHTHEVLAERAGGKRLLLRLDGNETVVDVRHAGPPDLRVVIDDSPVSARVSAEDGMIFVSYGGETYPFGKPGPPGVEDSASGTTAAGLVAPMPGTVVRVLVSVGDEVEEGQLLLVLEAMKMEQPFTAPHAGRVKSLPYKEGSLAPGGAVLVGLEE